MLLLLSLISVVNYDLSSCSVRLPEITSLLWEVVIWHFGNNNVWSRKYSFKCLFAIASVLHLLLAAAVSCIASVEEVSSKFQL